MSGLACAEQVDQAVRPVWSDDHSRGKGGKKRMAALTPEQRKELAKKAAQARWARVKKKAKRPGMTLEIVVERLIAAIESRDLILLFNPAYENGHSASHCPDESFRWISGFTRCEICKTL